MGNSDLFEPIRTAIFLRNVSIATAHFTSYSHGCHWRAIYEMASSLKCEDVHLTERYALVPKGKTRAARRTLPLTENALRVLTRRMRGEWCFPSRRSETGHVVNVRKLHQQACRNAGLKF